MSDGASQGPETCLRVAEALNHEGDELVRLRQFEDALVCYSRVLEQFGKALKGELGRQVRTALGRRGGTLVMLDRFTEADADFNEFCLRTTHASDPEQALVQAQELIVRIIYRHARVLFKEKHYEATIAGVDTLLKRFSEEAPLGCLELIVAALSLKASALADFGRTQEALETLSQLSE